MSNKREEEGGEREEGITLIRMVLKGREIHRGKDLREGRK